MTRKQLGLLLVAIIIAGIFAIGNYGGTIIPVVYGDYNTSFSHTRTPIFTDTQFFAPSTSIAFKSVAVGGENNGATSFTIAAFSALPGDALVVMIYVEGAACTMTLGDSLGTNFGAAKICGSTITTHPAVDIFAGITSTSGTDTVTVSNFGGGSANGMAVVADYVGVSGFGQTGTNQQQNLAAGAFTNSVTLTGMNVNSWIATAFTAESMASFTNPPGTTQRTTGSATVCPTGANDCPEADIPAGGASATLTWSMTLSSACNPGLCGASQSAIELQPGQPATASSSIRWNFNSTCVTAFTGSNPGPGFVFDFSKGTSGSGGANCSSADIVISKSPANLQTAAGRMLEMVAGWFDNSGNQIANLTLTLRTNATLPVFTQNYNAMGDVQNRLVWTFRPNYTGGGQQTVYVVRDQSHSVNTDGAVNDLIIQGKFDTITKPNAQTVLNFTGPTNFMEAYGTSAAVSSSNNTASSLQFGQDYYILAQATFTGMPGGSDNARFETIVAGAFGPNVSPFGIWSVPASCNDPVNKSPCSLPTATPTFQFNPLDPSSWGNAIIKGLIWVFTVAVGQATFVVLQVILPLLIQTLNLIGNFFGLGNIGTDISTLLNNWVTFFTNQLPTAFNNLGTLFLRWFDSLTILFSWVPIALSIASNLLSLGINGIGFVLLIVQDTFLLWDTMIVLMLILFWFADIGEYGLSGFQIWIETFKYLVFGLGMRPLLAAIHYGTDVILLMVGILPKPIIQIAAKFDTIIPSIDISGQPTWPNFTMEEVRKGNYFSVLGFLIGVIVLVWFETTSLPGSITALVPGIGVSLTRLAGIPNLLLIFLEIFGFMALFILPAQLFQSMGMGLSTPSFGMEFRRGPQVTVSNVGLRIAKREPGRILKRAEKKLGQVSTGQTNKRLAGLGSSSMENIN